MTHISERYRRRADQFESKLAAVTPDAWNRPSPCPDWDALGVVRHLVESSQFFLSWVEMGETGGPAVGNDPMGAWRALRAGVEQALNDPAVADRVLERSMGTMPFAQFVDQYLSFDLVVHAWDLAKAAGIDDQLNPVDVREVKTQAESMVEIGRKMGAFGPAVDATDGAEEQTQLLALLGRRR